MGGGAGFIFSFMHRGERNSWGLTSATTGRPTKAPRLSYLQQSCWFTALITFLLTALCAKSAPQGGNPSSQYAVRWITDPSNTNKIAAEVSGLGTASLQGLRRSNWGTAEWQRLFSIYAEQGDLLSDLNLPPMLGAYAVEGAILRFMPQFPLTPGLRYRAVFHPGQLPGGGIEGKSIVAATFHMPRRRLEPTTVVSGVYPSAGVVPENLLKFYLYFSAPMSRGNSYDYIHLQDEAGKEVELPFLELDEELWDPAMRRLTLFIDPGRIKRGVRPLEEIGPSLQEGKRFTLVIDREWLDATETPFKETFRKSLKVGPPDREPPDPAQWKVQPPKPATRNQLTVQFPESMDYALARRVLRVMGGAGDLVDGTVQVEDEERRWAFVPSDPWRRGSYQLLIQTALEDLAGNSIGKPFEVDVFEGVQRQRTNSTTRLLFEIR